MTNVTPEYVEEIIEKFEVADENKQRGVMGIEGNVFPVLSNLLFIHMIQGNFVFYVSVIWFDLMTDTGSSASKSWKPQTVT